MLKRYYGPKNIYSCFYCFLFEETDNLLRFLQLSSQGQWYVDACTTGEVCLSFLGYYWCVSHDLVIVIDTDNACLSTVTAGIIHTGKASELSYM